MPAPVKRTVLKFLLNSSVDEKPRPVPRDNKLKSNCQDEETNMVHLQDRLNIKYLIKKINLTHRNKLFNVDLSKAKHASKKNKQTNKQTNKNQQQQQNDSCCLHQKVAN